MTRKKHNKRKQEVLSPGSQNESTSKKVITDQNQTFSVTTMANQSYIGANNNGVSFNRVPIQPMANINYSGHSQGSINGPQYVQQSQIPQSPNIMGVGAGQYIPYITSTPVPLQNQQTNNTMAMDPLTLILNRLDTMDTKLGKLKDIEDKVSSLTDQINNIGMKVASLETKVADIEKSRDFDAGEIGEIRRKHDEVESLKSKVKRMEQERQECDNVIKELRHSEIKNNLLFFKVQDGAV